MEDFDRTHRNKTLAMWLRHKPERGGLTLSKEGWADKSAILEAFERAEIPTSLEELDEVIRRDPKGRFEVQGDRVRARYGHSLELEEKPHPGMPPATLFHGISRRYLPKILETGLSPMKRQYVHLSPDRKTAREVGRRREQEPAVLEIAAHEAHSAGVKFYPRGKGIWISDPIPPQFLRVMEEAPGSPANGPSVRSSSRELRKAAPGEPRRRRPKGGFVPRVRKNDS
jgi:putative RNA 2'-phosphotransferase